eukprot:11054384-Alexandrium_andersonii.AAC.1
MTVGVGVWEEAGARMSSDGVTGGGKLWLGPGGVRRAVRMAAWSGVIAVASAGGVRDAVSANVVDTGVAVGVSGGGGRMGRV